MLPNFLGIGIPRSGTTWLHELLRNHPQIYVPTQRKEIRFFDQYYDRGLDWYEKFFPDDTEAGQYRAVGEISPQYILSRKTLERIRDVGTVDRFLLMLRNPVDMAYSYYGLKVKNTNYTGTFDQFLVDHPEAIERGYYSKWLESFYDLFPKDRLLVMISEQAVEDVEGSKARLAEFLNVSVDRFPDNAGQRRVNPSYVPKAPALYSFIVGVSKRLKRWDGLTDFVKKTGVKKLFMSKQSLPPITDAAKSKLEGTFSDDISKVETMLGIDLDCWR
jgi:hypothetical protein